MYHWADVHWKLGIAVWAILTVLAFLFIRGASRKPEFGDFDD